MLSAPLTTPAENSIGATIRICREILNTKKNLLKSQKNPKMSNPKIKKYQNPLIPKY